MRYYNVRKINFRADGFAQAQRRLIISNKAGRISLLINKGFTVPYKNSGYSRIIKTHEGTVELSCIEFDYYFTTINVRANNHKVSLQNANSTS